MEDRVKELEAKVAALMYRVAALEIRPYYGYTQYPITGPWFGTTAGHPQYQPPTLYGEIK